MAYTYTEFFKIEASPSNGSNSNVIAKKNQAITFINVKKSFPEQAEGVPIEKPTYISYDDEDEAKNAVALLNYYSYSKSDGDDIVYKLSAQQGLSPMSTSQKQTYDLFRREVLVTERDDEGNPVSFVPLTPLTQIGADLPTFWFKDFKVSNDRTYQYIIYPTTGGDKIIRQDFVLDTKWYSWSITELHPTDSTGKNFSASKDDVWLFNFNVDTGEQNQNITRNENITLGQYPRYSEGRQNYVSGSVSCLLGSQLVSASYLQKKPNSGQKVGSYVEYRMFDTHPTSNEKVDMLKAWRKVVKSKNPKLLKDRKGQIFVVTLNQSSNKPYDYIVNQPDVINFSWTEIMSIDDIFITNAD